MDLNRWHEHCRALIERLRNLSLSRVITGDPALSTAELLELLPDMARTMCVSMKLDFCSEEITGQASDLDGLYSDVGNLWSVVKDLMRDLEWDSKDAGVGVILARDTAEILANMSEMFPIPRASVTRFLILHCTPPPSRSRHLFKEFLGHRAHRSSKPDTFSDVLEEDEELTVETRAALVKRVRLMKFMAVFYCRVAGPVLALATSKIPRLRARAPVGELPVDLLNLVARMLR